MFESEVNIEVIQNFIAIEFSILLTSISYSFGTVHEVATAATKVVSKVVSLIFLIMVRGNC